jgi:hypothetical protein
MHPDCAIPNPEDKRWATARRQIPVARSFEKGSGDWMPAQGTKQAKDLQSIPRVRRGHNRAGRRIPAIGEVGHEDKASCHLGIVLLQAAHGLEDISDAVKEVRGRFVIGNAGCKPDLAWESLTDFRRRKPSSAYLEFLAGGGAATTPAQEASGILIAADQLEMVPAR